MSDTEKKLDFDYFWKSRVINWDSTIDRDLEMASVSYVNLKEILTEMFAYIEENLKERK